MQKTPLKNIREKVAEQLATNLSKGIIYIQLKWTEGMKKLFSKLSMRLQVMLFTLFVLSGMVYCGWMIYEAVFHGGNQVPVAQQHVSASTEKPQFNNSAPLYSKDLESNIHAFQLYRDSLKNIGGKPWMDFKNKYRGLLDSLGLSEQE